MNPPIILSRHHARQLFKSSRSTAYTRFAVSSNQVRLLPIGRLFFFSTSVKSERQQQLPTVDYCPICEEPSSSSRYAYEIPQDLPIDTTSKLSGNVARHAVNFMISTGRNDWTKTIEEEQSSLAEKMKSFLGRGGKYNDPYNNITITNTSFPIQPPQFIPTGFDVLPYTPKPFSPSTWTPLPSIINPATIIYTSAIIAPLGLHLPYIPLHSQPLIENLIRGFLLPTDHDDTKLQRSPTHAELFKKEVADLFKIRPQDTVHDISQEIRVLVCGHEIRDKRCGILGPVVADALTDALHKQGYTTNGNDGDGNLLAGIRNGRGDGEKNASVGLISHIGGHKFAGNVIIYLPAHHPLSEKVNEVREKSSDGNERSGERTGISVWYGRVKPEHADGIVRQTIEDGIVVEELLRGIVDGSGEVVTLPE